MGEANRRKLLGSQRTPPTSDPKEFAGRSLGSVFDELAPTPGQGWKWSRVEGHGGEIAYIFEHPEYPGIERIIGGTVDLEFYRSTSDANPFDEGEDRYHTLAEAIAAIAA